MVNGIRYHSCVYPQTKYSIFAFTILAKPDLYLSTLSEFKTFTVDLCTRLLPQRCVNSLTKVLWRRVNTAQEVFDPRERHYYTMLHQTTASTKQRPMCIFGFRYGSVESEPYRRQRFMDWLCLSGGQQRR